MMNNVQSIQAILREVATPQKSLGLALCDATLKPLNTVLGMRKVVWDGDNWIKEERTNNRALIIIAYLATVIFAPLMMAVLLIKARSEEHKLLISTYQFDKKNRLFSTRIDKFDHLQEDWFSFDLKRKSDTSALKVSFTWFGKLKAKKLFSQI